MENENEIYIEKVHGRKSKAGLHFKGVVQKVLVSSLVLTSVLGSTSGAFAAEPLKLSEDKIKTIAYEDGISIETAISQIKNTISTLKLQITQKNVKKESLETLASQLYQLEKSANGKSTPEIVETISEVETTVSGIKENEQVMIALQQVKDSLGISTVKARKSNAASSEIAFADVKPSDWFYNSVMDMAKQEYLLGIGATNELGEKLFDVQSSMTRAAYVTIAVRIAYGDELKNTVVEGGNWWDAAYTVAQNHGILSATDPDFMSNPSGEIRREEMALILQRTAHAKGVSTANLVYATQIPDFQDVKGYYREAVRECYTLGMLNGVDQIGTFNPQGTLDRASASQSFYKLLNADKRTPVSPVAPENPFKNPNASQSGNAAYKPADELQTWVEGEAHTIPQEGDTVIAKDGRTVVLTMNQVGDSDLYLLGWGQGVDIITGTQYIKGGPSQKSTGGGHWADGSPFCDNKVNNEVYSKTQWAKVMGALGEPKEDGTYDGEMRNTYFQWDSVAESWLWKGGK